jgi:uncharacterized protein with beta-barrel porin domain
MTSQSAPLPPGTIVTVAFDGGAGNGSDGGPVNVTLESGASIHTSGTNSYGVLAQSVGGGGGVIVAGPTNVNPNNLFTHAQDTPGGGLGTDGGSINVNTAPLTQIVTTGPGAVGILAQSIGGGGGIINGMDTLVLTNVPTNSPTNRQQTGQGGDITIYSDTEITTSGPNAHGIFAQSVGQGGGVVGSSGGADEGYLFGGNGTFDVCGPHGTVHCTGDVSVYLNGGAITTSGSGSYGVYIDSQGNGSNNALLDVNAYARITAAGNAAAAVFLNGAGSNTINVAADGVIDASQSQSDVAITSFSNRKASIDNKGTITGTVTVGVGSTFDNEAGATLNAGPTINLGTGGVLTNNGTLSAGASGKIANTVVTGNLVQGAAGTLIVDMNLSTGAADQITVNGSASIAGLVEVHSASLANHAPITVLTATDGVTVQPTLSSPGPGASPLISFQTTAVGNTLQVQPKADFTTAAAGLGSSQRAVADFLQDVWDSGSSMGGGFGTLAQINNAAAYAASLNSLSGQTLGAIAAVRYQSGQNFISNMYDGCPIVDQGGEASSDSSCAWGHYTDSHTRRDMTTDVLGYTANAQSWQMGSQKEIDHNFFVGGSVAYEMSDLHGNAYSTEVDGKSALAGVSVRYDVGRWQLSGALDGGHGWYSTTRLVSVGSSSSVATASPTLWNAGVNFRVGYELPIARWYAKPFLDLHEIYLHSDAYVEHGAGAFDLAVDHAGDAALAATAGVEIGSNISLGKTALLRPFVSAAGEYLSDSDWAATARFADAPVGSGFRTSTPLPDALARLAIGAEIVGSQKWDVRLQYSPDIGKDYVSHMGAVKFDVRF